MLTQMHCHCSVLPRKIHFWPIRLSTLPLPAYSIQLLLGKQLPNGIHINGRLAINGDDPVAFLIDSHKLVFVPFTMFHPLTIVCVDDLSGCCQMGRQHWNTNIHIHGRVSSMVEHVPLVETLLYYLLHDWTNLLLNLLTCLSFSRSLSPNWHSVATIRISLWPSCIRVQCSWATINNWKRGTCTVRWESDGLTGSAPNPQCT